MDQRKIIVPFIQNLSPELMDQGEFENFSDSFDQIGRPLQVDVAPWAEYPYRPEVSLRIAASEHYLLLRFLVKEKEILGRFEKDGPAVEQDSCVHFYMAPESADRYYHFSFNCLGACFAEFREPGEKTRDISESLLKDMFRISSLGDRGAVHLEASAGELSSWSLMAALPGDVFFKEDIESFQGLRFKGNFCKSGEGLKDPHYLSWNRIEAETPDFDRPEYFGEIWIG